MVTRGMVLVRKFSNYAENTDLASKEYVVG